LGLGTFAVTPPPGVDWKGSELGDAREGRVALFAREFTPTHTLFAASVPDVVRPAMQAEYGAKMAGRSDVERLELALRGIEADAPMVEPGVVENFRRMPSERPAERQGATCEEYAYETVDRRVPGHPGEPFRMVLRGYVCIDPMTRRPIQILLRALPGDRGAAEARVRAGEGGVLRQSALRSAARCRILSRQPRLSAPAHANAAIGDLDVPFRSLALTLVVGLAACAADPAARGAWFVSPGTQSIGNAYTVETPIQWFRKPQSRRLEVWSSRDREGWEDELVFLSGLIPGEPLVPHWRRAPLYRAGMTPAEIAQFIVDSHVHNGGHLAGTVHRVWPAPFASVEGFRYEFGYTTKIGIEVHGFGAGGLKDGKLFLIYLTAVDPYFDQLRPVTEQIIESTTL
jgi:hypothetical protein